MTEVVELDEPMREVIAKGVSAHDLRAHVLRIGAHTLDDGALEALRSSHTTLEEITRQHV